MVSHQTAGKHERTQNKTDKNGYEIRTSKKLTTEVSIEKGAKLLIF